MANNLEFAENSETGPGTVETECGDPGELEEKSVLTEDPNFYEEDTQPKSKLAVQDLSKLDVSKLQVITPEVISRQATINIGTIGHVAHGKSTVVKAISGVQTVRFTMEIKRNITIKLGLV